MTELQRNVIAWLATYGMHSTLWLGMTWLVSRWVRSAACRVWLWRGAALGGVVSTALVAALATSPVAWRFEPLAQPPGQPSGAPVVIHYIDELRSSEPSSSNVPSAGRATHIDWESWLLAVWVVGALMGLVHLAWQHLRLARSLSSRRPVSDGEIERLSALARVRRPRLSVSAALASPIALARGEIVVPARAFTCLDSRQRAALLAHELAHLSRRDPAWLVVLSVLERLLFFQPLNRLATTRSLESAELACDEIAARWTNGGLDLARCLAEVASWSTQRTPVRIATGLVERPSALLMRVEHLLAQRSVRRPRAQAALTCVWLIATLAALGWAGPHFSQAQDGATPPETSTQSTKEQLSTLEKTMERYLLGGSFTLRGFDFRGQGPVETDGVILVQPERPHRFQTDERVTAALNALDDRLDVPVAFHVGVHCDGVDPTLVPVTSHTLELRADGTIHCGIMQVYFPETHDVRLLNFHVAEIARCIPDEPAPLGASLSVRMDERAPLYLLQRVREASKGTVLRALQIALIPSSAQDPFSIPVGEAGPTQELDILLAIRLSSPSQSPRVVEFDVDYKLKSGASREKLTTTQVDSLRFFLQCAHAAGPERRVVLEPHTGTVYSDIMLAIEAAHEAGFTTLVLSDRRR